MKKIIITSDDLGIDIDTNKAIDDAFNNGALSSSCLMANCEGFDDALENVIKKNPNLDIGVHLNIIEGKALTGISSLTDGRGFFNCSYIKMLLNSYNKNFMNDIEKEFRAQIEKILNNGVKPSYINTHVHTHSIPNQFRLVCKLANEYGIKNIRTQGEKPYYTKGLYRHFTIRYLLNIIKSILLNTFTFINRFAVKKYNLNTNHYFIGVLYTGCMDEHTIISGVNVLPKESIAEIIVHPSINSNKPRHYKEYKGLLSNELKEYFNNNQNTEKISWKVFD